MIVIIIYLSYISSGYNGESEDRLFIVIYESLDIIAPFDIESKFVVELNLLFLCDVVIERVSEVMAVIVLNGE